MENPNTWTPLHYELDKAHRKVLHCPVEDQAEALLVVFEKNSLQATQEEVVAALNEHAKGIEDRRCGVSLPALLVQRFK